MKPEALAQRRIQGALKACGYLSIHIPNRGLYDPSTNRYNIKADPFFLPGVPDLCVLLPENKVLWVEVKSAIGKQSPAQIRVQTETFPRYGHRNNCILARGPEEVMAWLKAAGYRYGEIV